MDTLVALDLPAGRAFLDALRRAWDDGDAIVPLDRRLPLAARRTLAEQLGASLVVSDGEAHHLLQGRPIERGDALVVATSGTTGAVKGVVLTHDAVRAHADAVHAHLAVDADADRWVACLPLAHVGGLGVVTRALLHEVPLVVHDHFDADALASASREGATLVSLVTTALDRIDPAPWRWIVLGGSADRIARPPNVVHTYGMTETGGGVVYDGVPLPGVDVRIVDGEIQLRTPTLLRAYRDGHDPRTPDGWYPTGDLGALGPSGHLEVFGRRDDMIVTGGENVWPQVVEDALRSAPGVTDVVVAGVEDDEWGQRVVAYVVADPSASPPDLAALRAHVKETLPAYAAPRELVFVEEVARTALGKVRRGAAIRHP